MPKIYYKPIGRVLRADEVRACVDACGVDERREIDFMLNALRGGVGGHGFGEGAALELLGRLVQYGLVGDGPVCRYFLKRIGRA